MIHLVVSNGAPSVRKHLLVHFVVWLMKSQIGPLLILVLLVAFTGCTGVSGIGSDVTDEEARERALDAEEQYITEQLENASCVESWSPTSFVGLEEEATIMNRTDKGVQVVVKHPYSVATEELEADTESEARYLVTPEDEDRISGTKVSPC